MGRDKALLEVDGAPMAVRVARALREAGAREIVAVGGSDELAALGLRLVPDEAPGAGPLGGIITAFGALPDDVVLVVSCDLVTPSAAAMRRTVDALAADVAVPSQPGGPPQWMHAAWRRSTEGPLRRCFAAGERSIHRAVAAAGLAVTPVDGIEAVALADADTPDALP